MTFRAAAKGRRLLLLAAVCLASTLLLTPAAEASRSLPAALAPALELPATPDQVLSAELEEPPERLRLFDDLRLPPRPLELVEARKTASGSSTYTLRLNIRQTGDLSRESGGLSFQGLWTDPVTGISYARNRWYDARTASWLSEDPKGAVDSPNLYAFVGWGPHVGRDPMGLASEDSHFAVQEKEILDQRRAEDQFRKGVDWVSDNNEAYAYAKSRRPDLDTDDPEFRDLMRGWFKTENGDCRDAWVFKSTAYWDCHARVEAGFPLSPEGILEARKNNRWFGDEEMMALRAWGEFFENVGMMEAWWAVGGVFDDVLALGDGVANVNKIIDDISSPGSGVAHYPPGLSRGFSNFEYGNSVHQEFAAALTRQTGTKLDDWIVRTRPGATGVDATYVGPPHRYPGFTNAELKPATYPGFEQFTYQLDNWIQTGHVTEGTTELWFYNQAGIIGTSGFRF